MTDNCKWEGQGNGHFLTSCGKLIYDKGRLIKMKIEYYGSKRTPIPIMVKCPNCGKKVIGA